MARMQSDLWLIFDFLRRYCPDQVSGFQDVQPLSQPALTSSPVCCYINYKQALIIVNGMIIHDPRKFYSISASVSMQGMIINNGQ